jgi:hypothetical protein
MEARHATVPRTKIDAFRHLVATFEQLLDAFSQILILAFLILYSQKFKYRVLIVPWQPRPTS